MENITTRPQIVKFKRGVNLILGQYRYKKDGKYKEKQHWRCTIVGQGCRGRTDQIMGIFTTLQQQPVVEGNNQLQALFTYYYDTWLTGPFPLELWNVHQTSTRTNNMVEGWHSRLNRYVRRLHPNLHQLVKELQKEQAMTQVTVQRARLGGAPPARRMKYVRIDEEVQRLTHKFDLDEITPMEYISGLRRVIHHY